MFSHNQGAPQRDHHQNAEQSTEHRDEHGSCDFEIEPENHDGRHGDTETKRD